MFRKVPISYINMNISTTRHNVERFHRGIVSEDSHTKREKRRLVSLQMTVVAWLYEFFSVLSAFLSPILKRYHIDHIHFVDCLIMFVIIPTHYLINDEDTRTVVANGGWCQGLRFILGIQREIAPMIPPNFQPPRHENALFTSRRSRDKIA